jgi:MFS family permease
MTVSDVCLKEDNVGWRYTLYTLGAAVLVLAALRFFIFNFPESPYFLLSQGRDAEAIKVVQQIAKRSNRPCLLTIEDFNEVNDRHGRDNSETEVKRSFKQIFLLQFKALHWRNLRPLFGTPKLALQTGIIVWIWAAIGVAYPLYSYFLPVYLQAQFTAIDPSYTLASTYQQYCYIAACTVPGPILAGFLVETRLGRRYTMAIGTIISGIFLCVSVVAARTNEALVAWNCIATLAMNFMFAIQVS